MDTIFHRRHQTTHLIATSSFAQEIASFLAKSQQFLAKSHHWRAQTATISTKHTRRRRLCKQCAKDTIGASRWCMLALWWCKYVVGWSWARSSKIAAIHGAFESPSCLPIGRLPLCPHLGLKEAHARQIEGWQWFAQTLAKAHSGPCRFWTTPILSSQQHYFFASNSEEWRGLQFIYVGS